MDTLGHTDSSAELFVGRQPILDRSLHTVGYELLFRDRADADAANIVDGDVATARVLIGTVDELGLDALVGPHSAFINLTANIIADPELLDAVPADRVVLEVLEDVEPTPAVRDGLRHFIDRGFAIAIDDLEYDVGLDPLIDLADIIKYDHSRVNGVALRERIDIDHAAGRLVVVEHVETEQAHHDAHAAGADYFQGFFFAKPSVVAGRAILPQRLTLLELLTRVTDPDASLDDIVDALSHDVAISVKALRHINTAAAGLKVRVDSVQQAAVLLGRNILRSWASLTLLSAFEDQPGELVTVALTRARFCELLAQRRRSSPGPATFYTVGLLSLLDTMTGRPMTDLVGQLSINDDISAGLLGHSHPTTEALRQARRFDTLHDVDVEPELLETYLAAVAWANELTAGLQPGGAHHPSLGRFLVKRRSHRPDADTAAPTGEGPAPSTAQDPHPG